MLEVRVVRKPQAGILRTYQWTEDPYQETLSCWPLFNRTSHILSWASQVMLVVKNLPASAGDVRETWVQSLDWEDSLEEGMATHSSILAWRIP